MGKNISPLAACVKLRELFSLHIDVADRDNLPLPTYKRTPIGEQLSQVAGFDLGALDLLVQEYLQSNVAHLHDTQSLEDLSFMYFGWERKQRKVIIPKVGPALLGLGWPDNIGIYRHGRGVTAQLKHWGTHESLCTGDHVPVKALVKLVARGKTIATVVNSIV